MKQSDRVPSLSPSSADPERPAHVGVRVLWGAIVGYATVAIIAVVVDTAAGGAWSALMTHSLGAFGAVACALLGARTGSDHSPRRSAPTGDRPHDGWIS